MHFFPLFFFITFKIFDLSNQSILYSPFFFFFFFAIVASPTTLCEFLLVCYQMIISITMSSFSISNLL